ncbi:zinc finger BED domain-containing protein 5-like [Tachypleus tridentatus]|uniref:zinc finger BED domain-containing protein 5-like n=1 Tax=Tachypleus tridentatus TaxID=6853 RepID=UPI003FD1C98D
MRNGSCALPIWLIFLNLQMQGRNTNIIKFMDSLKYFMTKLKNWKRKVKVKNVATFEKLSSILVTGGKEKVLPEFGKKNEILQHLTALENEFSRYFPELSNDELDLVRNPFKFSVEKVSDDCQDEFLVLKIDSGARDMFNEKSITEFWPLMCDSCPKVAERAIHALLPFVSTYLCKLDL